MRWFILFVFVFILLPGFAQEYHFRQVTAIPDEEIQQISCLFQSADHLVWIGTDKGLYSFDGRKYIFKPRPDQQSKKVTTIGENTLGQIYVGYEDGYIHELTHYGHNAFVPADSLSGYTISKILFNQDGEIIITTYGKGIWVWKEARLRHLKFESLAVTDDIYDALIDQQGKLWMATDNGIWIYSKEGGERLRHLSRKDGLPDEIVTQLELFPNGDVSIGLYDHGLARYILERDTILTLMSLQPNSGNVIGLVKGHAEDVWLGSEKAVLKYDSAKASNVVSLPAELNDRLESLLFDVNGNLWLSSGNKLFIASTLFEYIFPGLSGIQAIAVSEDKIWIGCKDGLYGFDRINFSVKAYLEKEKINILSLYTDPTGVLWIGTFGQGLYIFDPKDNQLRRLTENDKLSNNSILNIDGKNNTVWLATLGGISQLNWKSNPIRDQLEIIRFQDKYNFPPGYVYDVYVSKEGRIWFGTDGKGLFYLDHDQLIPYVIAVDSTKWKGDEIRTVYSIATDSKQQLWISVPKGQILNLDTSGNLLKLIQSSRGSPNTLMATGDGEIMMIKEGEILIKRPGGEMLQMNESSGLKSFSPNINASVRDMDGSVWIAGADRLIHYNPFSEDTQRYVVMQLEGNTSGLMSMNDAIRLSPDSNFLDIRFTGLWYQAPEDVRYRYMLQGHDQDWIYSREGRAVYSKLGPGTYTFIVEGSHLDDFSFAKPLRKDIIVMPPLYLRWWFVVGISLLVSYLIFSYILTRIKRLKRIHQLEKEKTTFQLHAIQAQVNPHFLFNSFNTLSNIIEEDQGAAVNYVDQLSGFFRGVLMHRHAELIRIEEEMDIIRNYTYILQQRYGDKLCIREDIRQKTGWIAPLSIQLLVENAIKHNTVSEEKPLVISITIDDQWITVSNPIQVKIGTYPDSTGFGLASLITRYHYLTKEKIEILREPNTFTVKIPVIHSEKPV